MRSKELFGKMSPIKLFFIAALPGSVSMLASMLYSISEGMIIGKYLGETSFAAINLAIPFVLINFSLADLVGVGSAVPISINLGRQDEKQANNIFTCSLIMIVGAGILMGAILFFSAPLLVGLMGADGLLAELAVRYIRIFALCSPLTTVVFATDNYLRICGIIKGSMFLNIFMSLLNVALIFVFVTVFDLGIAGSAAAICISFFVCAIIALYPFLRKKLQLRLCRPRFSAHMVGEIIACGSPAFLNNVAGRVTSIVMNIMLMSLGGAPAVAVYGVLMYSSDFILPLLYGMCDSLQPAIGYNLGAGSHKRVKQLASCYFVATALISLLMTALMNIVPDFIVGIYMNTDDAAFEMATRALKLFSLAYLVRWFGFSAQSFFSAIERPLAASVLSVASALVFPLLFAAVLYPLELDGIWLNFTASSLCVSLLALPMLVCQLKRLRTNKEA